jgi:hypothetical protein
MAVQRLDNGGRGADRGEEAVPQRRHQVGEARLDRGRHIRQLRHALAGDHGEGP